MLAICSSTASLTSEELWSGLSSTSASENRCFRFRILITSMRTWTDFILYSSSTPSPSLSSAPVPGSRQATSSIVLWNQNRCVERPFHGFSSTSSKCKINVFLAQHHLPHSLGGRKPRPRSPYQLKAGSFDFDRPFTIAELKVSRSFLARLQSL